MAERFILIALVVLIAVLALSNHPYGLQFKRFVFLGFDTGSASEGFELQLTALRAKLAALESLEPYLPNFSENYLTALVYSRYPFNFKNEILVNAGSQAGIAPSQVAIIVSNGDSQAAIFVGTVTEVFQNSALIRTIFDSRSRFSVKVGSKGVEALLSGGSEPRLTLIKKEESVEKGDAVYLAGVNLPYGLAVGEVKEVALSSDNIFKEATLDFPYSVSELKAVAILK